MATRLRSALAGRGFVLFPAAAFGVHQLRYQIAYGSRAGAALSAQGHSYQNSLAPWVAILLALGLGSFVTRLARAAAGDRAAYRRRPFAALFLVASALLLATYCTQEWLEGIFASGHPSGVTGVFGHGGWWAVPLSAAAGLAVAALLTFAAAAVELVAELVQRRRALVAPERLRLPATVGAARRRSALATAAAGRAPPRVAFV